MTITLTAILTGALALLATLAIPIARAVLLGAVQGISTRIFRGKK